ncbi:hypothetical protein GUITHDRAFT_119065 [Guillardia theta CCMP2712]|uniref:Uncharacterized protein n=1 Tax=Guillardia theta (strain CCMP2712) TaxID=905079 RepID=L1IER5_GUITC|nr:hypothetical protein GUITHDRAFT_119065 [Guillardia theta CCMP2712]EKX34756.1 hypothetical protein GUITHDRAFT_119065 [Guillardia theta CCMP2712]|eukprot:XP_005821736.1 hypothetical protein GUITHDRAFT_119065 [Guillardia theta CCMP2712]
MSSTCGIGKRREEHVQMDRRKKRRTDKKKEYAGERRTDKKKEYAGERQQETCGAALQPLKMIFQNALNRVLIAPDHRENLNNAFTALEEMYNDKQAQLQELKKDKAAQLQELKKDKAAQLQELKKDKAALQKHKAAQLEISQGLLQDTRRSLAEAREKCLQTESSRHAVLNNRALIEIGLLRKFPGMTTTQALDHFIAKHLLQNPKQRKSRKLRPDCVSVCNQLANQYNLACSHASVANELSGLMHEISKPVHSRMKAPAGYFVGGPSPLAQAIACVLLKLQGLGSIARDMDVFLIDDGGKIVCRLANGKIQPASPSKPGS